jgi:hypothetical protein
MLWRLIQLLSIGLAVVLLVLVEVLDWKGRMELIEQNWPGAWKVLNSRPARLLLLVLAVGFLARDFKDAVEVGPVPVVTIVPQAVGNPPRVGDSIDAEEIARRVAELTGHNLTLKKKLLGLIEAISDLNERRSNSAPPMDIRIDKDKDPVAWNVEWRKYEALSAKYQEETWTVYKRQIQPSVLQVLKDVEREQGIDTRDLQRSASEYQDFYNLRSLLAPLLDKL